LRHFQYAKPLAKYYCQHSSVNKQLAPPT